MLIVAPPDFCLSNAPVSGAVLDWARSNDARQVHEHGQCAAALLPRDDEVVLVLPPRALSWHRLHLPKVAQAKLRALLEGALEDRLLQDCGELHFALETGAKSGQPVWVAACRSDWLRGWLQALEAAGRPVTRIVPSIWPLKPDADPPSLHWAHSADATAWLASASPLGVSCTPLRAPSVATARAADPGPARWLADPAQAELAEQLLPQRFELLTRHARLLQCAQSDWNLAQFNFSLSAAARRGQRLRQNLRHWRNAVAWRPARWGLATLLALQLVGLNAAAWTERASLQAKQQALQQTLQDSFPHVTLVLDAPLQMQRELARLQQAGGHLAADDLETLLSALARAMPVELTPPSTIDYENGVGRFGGWQAHAPALDALVATLQQNGWDARLDGQQLLLRPDQPPPP
ncbi:type II secretion system protein GspL [Hydrogenophaga sp.]|uniref:type II secretion system protein GspL n=1 Tax=Hydrogenophaga sp. TaxID=1904254 RepID=UPI0019BCC286|nr:type II secretion system protein GspL [Hydrogenophaga sp.]MBD3892619.1 general secretion pathway protein GspL [Hydrogenophaga sp.]